MTSRFAIVGCGKQKLDIDEPKVPIARLYTSNYFELKRTYAKKRCDDYGILSAKHGLALPGKYVSSYDLTIDDLDDDELEDWVEEVSYALELIASDSDVIVLLVGQKYLDPLEPALEVIDSSPEVDLRRPFNRLGGIGEQMAWLRAQIDEADRPVPRDPSTATLAEFTGGESA